MSIEDLEIIPPEGMEWYQEGNKIKFRPKTEITYNDIAYKLFRYKKCYCVNTNGSILKFNDGSTCDHASDPNNCTSEKQAQKFLAINQLMNVAKYLNEDWIPDWGEGNNEFKYYINIYHKKLSISYTTHYNGSVVYFKSEKLAQKAVEILGEDLIYLALSTDR